MSSPGAGKTSLLEKTISALKTDYHIGVIEGDIQSSQDAERIGKTGAPVVQINTDGACHLDANMIRDTFAEFERKDIHGRASPSFSGSPGRGERGELGLSGRV